MVGGTVGMTGNGIGKKEKVILKLFLRSEQKYALQTRLCNAVFLFFC